LENLEEMGNGKVILNLALTEIGRKNVERVHLAKDGDKWRAVVKTVMNLRVP
jgi:hypothetical protein